MPNHNDNEFSLKQNKKVRQNLGQLNKIIGQATLSLYGTDRTSDVDSLNDHSVTIRERDSMKQVRLPIDQVASYISEKIKF